MHLARYFKMARRSGRPPADMTVETAMVRMVAAAARMSTKRSKGAEGVASKQAGSSVRHWLIIELDRRTVSRFKGGSDDRGDAKSAWNGERAGSERTTLNLATQGLPL